MRPVKLTMKAFGSFARETVVDFDKLGGGLYLIVGKTGAGKTTIFDAISFALFGEPSGSERDAKMFHSDFVPLSEDTVVKLSFVHNGRQYLVERNIHFKKNRETGKYKFDKIDVVLTGEGMAPVEGANKVKDKSEEILGMNGDQFRRIVMLAQGEFREFMKSDSEAKNRILGKLFDSTEFVRYQSLLKAARDDLNGRVRQQSDSINNAMKHFTLPDGEEESDYLPGNPHLEENLRGLAAREQEKLTELQTACEQWNKAVGELNTRKGAAETNNSLFDELSRKREHLAALDTRKETVAENRRMYESAEKAQHGVKPLDDAFTNARNDYDDTAKKLSERKALSAVQREEVRKAEEQVQADAPLTKEKEDLTAKAKVLSDSLPGYKVLTQKEAAIKAQQTSLASQKRQLERLSEQKSTSETQLAAMEKELAGLQGCEREEERLTIQGQTARKNYDAIAPKKPGSVSEEVNSVLKEEAALAEDEKTLAGFASAVLAAENVYHDQYQQFISGQAGLMARKMEQELAEKGETFCPVCHTHFCRNDGHHFTELSVEIPSQAEVDKAKQDWESAEKKYQDKKTWIDGKRIQLEERKSGIVRKMGELGYDSVDWNTLVSPGYLAYICEERKRELNEVIIEYKAAKAKVDRKTELDTEKKNTSDGLTELAKQYEEKDKERQQTELAIIRMQGEAEQIKKQLSCESEAEATHDLADLNNRISALQSILSAHEETLRNARDTANRTEGAVKQLEDSLPGKKEAQQKAQHDLSDSVRGNGFGSYDDYRGALGWIVGNAENWLRAKKMEIDSYHNDVRNTRDHISDLEQQTEGKEIIDLAKLNSELNDAQSKQAETEHAKTVQYNLLSSHQGVLAIVEIANKKLAGLEGAFRRMDRLANLAGGVSGEGGKLSFERYVMGAIFHEVLVMANRRLNIMTGGRFELIHKIEADRKSSAAGLEMEVLDISTGKQRPSASISGGEGFMVSLALALGLSDVVQSHAGGKKLDTLFIDEGFGTLDDGKLDNVIQVLQQLTEGNRLVGIISHVDKLEESIPQKLRVSSGEHGSTVSMELS